MAWRDGESLRVHKINWEPSHRTVSSPIDPISPN
jgi:hypothetical protein